MAGTTLYLIRSSNVLFARQDNVIDVFLSSREGAAYTSVTGVASTDVVTITGAALTDGMLVTLTSLTGGSGLSTGVGYYAVSSSGATCKLSLTPGGSAINFTTDITSGSAVVQIATMRVWSAEYRDIFSNTGSIQVKDGSAQGGLLAVDSAIVPTSLTPSAFSGGTTGTASMTVGGIEVEVSDEINHEPLRQTLLNKTFWIFDRGASATPRYLPAEYQEGDIIATSPPNTP